LRDLQIVKYDNAQALALRLRILASTNAKISAHISGGKGFNGLRIGRSGTRSSFPGLCAYGRGWRRIVSEPDKGIVQWRPSSSTALEANVGINYKCLELLTLEHVKGGREVGRVAVIRLSNIRSPIGQMTPLCLGITYGTTIPPSGYGV
jgi:hypothetical protein